MLIAHEAPKTSGFGGEIASTIQASFYTIFLNYNIQLTRWDRILKFHKLTNFVLRGYSYMELAYLQSHPFLFMHYGEKVSQILNFGA